ncbi:MAG: AraC family transcriptional regulator [Lachnospiraceae bacterium]|nr:AraC family transcriptional regulator [Lachnospiraceae bacterium]
MLEILKIGERSTHTPDFEVDRPNGYPHYLVLLVQSPARYLVDGCWQDVKPDSAVVFLPGQKHRYTAADGKPYIDSWFHARFQESVFDSHFPFGEPFPLRRAENYYALFHVIYDVYFSATPHSRLTIHHLGISLLNMLADEIHTQSRPPIYDSLVRLRESVYQHPERDWTVPTMADFVSVSPGYLHKIYKQYFGTTCNRDIIQSRTEAACELLASSNKPVGQVAEACGYQNVEHFVRQFKACTGVTPGNYRKKC